MKRFMLILIAISSFTSFLFTQRNPQLEFSTAFPFQGFQNKPREYFLTTQYSAGLSLSISSYSNFVTTITFTQQNPSFVQEFYYQTHQHLDSRTYYVPFTTDPYYSEYGIFSGMRLITKQRVVQIFVKGQLGMTGTKYGRIGHAPPYRDPYGMPVIGERNNDIDGSVVKLQLAGLYGAGIVVHPTKFFSLVVNIHAINRFTKQSVDIYQNVGVQFGL